MSKTKTTLVAAGTFVLGYVLGIWSLYTPELPRFITPEMALYGEKWCEDRKLNTMLEWDEMGSITNLYCVSNTVASIDGQEVNIAVEVEWPSKFYKSN